MPERADPPQRRRRLRSDARRSASAILSAATPTLGERPDASMEDIAEAAGVTRQTIYAHYPSRETLVRAVIGHVVAEVVEAMEAAEPDDGKPADALIRLLDASWRAAQQYSSLMRTTPMTAQQSSDSHQPILDTFERLIRRGLSTGDFTSTLPPTWLLSATLALAHTAGEQVVAGRLTTDEAVLALRDSVLRIVGATSPTAINANSRSAD